MILLKILHKIIKLSCLSLSVILAVMIIILKVQTSVQMMLVDLMILATLKTSVMILPSMKVWNTTAPMKVTLMQKISMKTAFSSDPTE